MMAPVGFYVLLFTISVFQETIAGTPQSKFTPQLQSFLNGFFTGATGGSSPPAPVTNQFQEPDYNSQWGTGLCDPECTCGVPNRSTRIIGGTPTEINEYPWVVAFVKNRKIFCGGTLITNLHVMTAAHCVNGNFFMLRIQTTIILAEHDISTTGESPMATRRIDSVVRHPDFRPRLGNMDGDIALVRMSDPVDFVRELAPACLPSPGNDFAGYKGVIAGWGRTSEKGSPSPELLAAVVPIYSQKTCLSETLYQTHQVTDHMMCAGRFQGGIDSCQGDSGGGLLVTDSYNRMVTAGIVSWGEGCARPYRPGIYTRVNHYLTWIQHNTKDACFCA